jgi:endo-1,4-beta-xylanase
MPKQKRENQYTYPKYGVKSAVTWPAVFVLVWIGACGSTSNSKELSVAGAEFILGASGQGTTGSGGVVSASAGGRATAGNGSRGTAGTGVNASGGGTSARAGVKNGSGGAGGATGVRVGTGGSGTVGIGSGGTTTGKGGAGTGGTTATSIPDSCTESDKTLTSNGTGQHCGYTYEYWKDQGTGTLVLKSDGFSVSWSGINNLLGRKGLRPGSAKQIVTYEANYQPNGNSYLCVYGWTKSPLIEYYIVDSWGSWRPPGGTSVGTVTSDGGTYDVYKTQRVNQPSIEGNTTFYQYWSVRTQKRTSGTITVANHFDAWASKGMNMGSLYEVSMTVEGYQSSGTADVKMSMK